MEYTPWGYADSMKEIVKGVTLVGTPSHGGLRVDKKEFSNLVMDKSFLRDVAIDSKHYYWFEEDCAAALFLFDAPQVIEPYLRETRKEYSNDLAEEFFQSIKGIVEYFYKDYFIQERMF